MKTLPKWIVIWLVISMLITCWDALFITLRPESFAGGKYAALFIPYVQYIKVDPSYADLQNDFVKSIAIMDFIEIGIGMIALCCNYYRKTAWAILLAFSSLLLTGTKTALVFILEAVNHFKHIDHNAVSVLIFQYILPNALWIVFPLLGVSVLGRYLVTR